MIAMPNSKYRILIVDDNKEIRNTVSKVLVFMGYEVVVASNGKEGLRLFLHSPFNLVITDLSMPELDGLTLASSIKERSPHTAVILMTGSKLENTQGRSVDLVLVKPFSLVDLGQKVQVFLRT
jgi:CheY-like chemotaxis protein